MNEKDLIMCSTEKLVIDSLIEKFESLSEKDKCLFCKNFLKIEYVKGMNIRDYI